MGYFFSLRVFRLQKRAIKITGLRPKDSCRGNWGYYHNSLSIYSLFHYSLWTIRISSMLIQKYTALILGKILTAISFKLTYHCIRRGESEHRERSEQDSEYYRSKREYEKRTQEDHLWNSKYSEKSISWNRQNKQMEKEINTVKTELDACRSATAMGLAETSSVWEQELPRAVSRHVLPSHDRNLKLYSRVVSGGTERKYKLTLRSKVNQPSRHG
jgi:hypothetical protein